MGVFVLLVYLTSNFMLTTVFHISSGESNSSEFAWNSYFSRSISHKCTITSRFEAYDSFVLYSLFMI